MKGFLVLLIFTVVGLAGVLYWRQSIQKPAAPAVSAASGSTKDRKERPKRRKRGARRLARNEVVARNDVRVATASPGEAPADEAPDPYASSPSHAPAPKERAPVAPGGSSTTEVAPVDVFGESPSPTRAPSGGVRQPIDEPEPVKLRAADLKIVWQGEDLSRAAPEPMRLDLSNDAGKELSQDEIDTRFRAKEDSVLGCVARARPDEYTFVPGRVTVRFRIQKTGTVKGVQVEAPVILHKGGLTGCIKGIMASLRFPASNMGQVVTYPFSLM